MNAFYVTSLKNNFGVQVIALTPILVQLPQDGKESKKIPLNFSSFQSQKEG